MTLVLVGSYGHLGNALVRSWTTAGENVVPLDLPDFDLNSRRIVLETLVPLKPDVIVNAAGLEQIDWLETHPNTSRSVHVQGTANLREAAKRTSSLLVQFSTSEVFGDAIPQDPEQGFTENEQPDPQNVYAKTKLDSERAAAEWEKHLIVRTSMLFGQTTERSSGSLVETIFNAVRRTRNFRIIQDRFVSPTWTQHLAFATRDLIHHAVRENVFGLFHLANGGVVSYFEIAKEIARKTGLKLEIEPIRQEEYGFKVPRGTHSALNCTRYHNLSGVFPMPTWKVALEQYLDSRAVSIRNE
ncbi:MAG: SDR family oxidoreductase [Planctomycetaceae bacterium]|nr:SDR family oxidoreductase [Planctomycetaceae bacterium]